MYHGERIAKNWYLLLIDLSWDNQLREALKWLSVSQRNKSEGREGARRDGGRWFAALIQNWITAITSLSLSLSLALLYVFSLLSSSQAAALWASPRYFSRPPVDVGRRSSLGRGRSPPSSLLFSVPFCKQHKDANEQTAISRYLLGPLPSLLLPVNSVN